MQQDWSKLFKSQKSSGVYTVEPASSLGEIEAAAITSGFAFFSVDLSGVRTKRAFLQTTSRALQFPAYFGMNWDAFEECIQDFAWSPSGGYVLVFDYLGEFAQNAPGEMRTARSIFRSAAAFWKKRSMPFFVLLVKR